MKHNVLFVLATCALALATACSSTPAKVDSGPVQGRTFSFINTGRPIPSYAVDKQAIHSMIQDAITRNLEARGVKKEGGNGDITVAYLVITGNNVSTTTLGEYFGYREDAAGLHDKAQAAYTGSKNPNHFEAGTLVIDLIDSKTFKVLKRGYATRPILRDPPNDVRAARIQEVVDEILRELRIEG